MPSKETLEEVFERLREIMIPFANDLDLKQDTTGSVYIDTLHIMENEKPLFFGAVQLKKRYVSYHLMPIYVNPELLANISDELRERVHGKSCLNFTMVDEGLFEELRQLTWAGHDYYRKAGYV